MSKTFQLKIITPERIVFDDQVRQVTLPAQGGEITVLADHANLLSTLGIGPIAVTKDGEAFDFSMGGGYVDINNNVVTILADTAESAEELDEQRAQLARDRAHQLMDSEHAAERDQALVAASLQKALTRLKVLDRYRSKRRKH